ncbi:hypothetical protein Zmor_023654 [Zophobas morio]|uniref:HAT C-terminal dimerisation domain-containing protein n=1 Tax=Zophobas morio TaxID=2755281 RepID=A0AA38M7J2_9CUCU|nr:hypothetical protein Zmor_023654 [Zophobas morio]
MFIAEHNLPFLVLDHLSNLLISVCSDSEIARGIHCSRKKGTNYCTQITGPENFNIVANDLKQQWFSLIIDESTDVSTTKCLAVVARYFKEEKVSDQYLGLIQTQDATAEGIFCSIKSLLEKNNIGLSKLVGFAADNASVMQGNFRGVQARFKQEVPDIFVLGCTCHSLALCSSAACRKLPASVECLARDIVNYFAHSSKRKDELKECQEFVNLKPHKLLKLCQVRWLSMQDVVNRILQQWPALILFFTNETNDNGKGNINNPGAILEAKQNPIFKLYFSFLSYVLDIINKINIEFQSEAPRIHLLHSRLNSLYTTLLKNFMKRDYIYNTSYSNIKFLPCNYKELNDIYCGATCEQIVSNNISINKTDLNAFKIKVLDFYKELAKQIQNRFDFDDPVLKFLKNVDPAVVVSGECESLVPIASRFPRLVTNLEQLNSEWRLLPDIPELKNRANHNLDKFWSYIFNLKNGVNEYMFPNLTTFMKGILCLPHSSATVERTFSQLTLIKTKNRNRLQIETCNALLHTKALLNGQKCYEFVPSVSLLKKNFDTNNNRDVNDEIEDLTF